MVAVPGFLLGVGLRCALPQLHFELPLYDARAAVVIAAGFVVSFARTRNPMYLGPACVLFGALRMLRNGASLLAVGVLVIYLDRFQIQPEDRILRAKLGAARGGLPMSTKELS